MSVYNTKPLIIIVGQKDPVHTPLILSSLLHLDLSSGTFPSGLVRAIFIGAYFMPHKSYLPSFNH